MLQLILILKITSQRARQLCFSAAAVACACTSQPGRPDSGVPNAQRAEVVAAAAHCARVTAEQFRDAAATLKTAASDFAASPGPATETAARDAFHAAFDAWQVDEAMLFGPAAPSTTPGGADLRDQINSWPLFSRCAVEEALVSKSYEAGVGRLLVNRRGMHALEYLLFYDGDDTACPATSPIVAQGTWAALDPAERAARKRAYAEGAAADVDAWARELVSAWEGGFEQKMTSAGPGNTMFATPQAALNVVSDAIFYVDFALKDTKLAAPLGLKGCGATVCPELVESPFAHRSKRNIAQNLVGLRRLTRGCGDGYDGMAFDDLLGGMGAGAAAQTLSERTEAVQAALEAIEEPDLAAALTGDRASVEALHLASKSLTSFLKTEFLTVLDLELPKTLEGDND